MNADTTMRGGCARASRADYRVTMHKAELGRRLQQLREDAGFTQAQLAKLLGTGQSTISAQETGVNEPNLETVWAWAKACGRSPTLEFISGRADDPRASLVGAVDPLPSADLALLTRIARALPDVDPTVKAAHADALETLARVGKKG